MKFIIEKTSTSWSEKQPCKEAFKEKCLRVDQRTFKTPEEYDKRLTNFPPWLSEGMNHRTTKIGIARDFECETWFINVDSLEQLLDFSKKYGKLIIFNSHVFVRSFPSIEIYDDYRK